MLEGAVGAYASPAALMARRLMTLGLVSPSDIVNSGFSVEDTSVSHRSFRVRVGRESRYYAKQIDPSHDPGRDLTVEAAVYRLARIHPGLQAVIPTCQLVTDNNSLIVMSAVAGTSFDVELLHHARAQLESYASSVTAIHAVIPTRLARPPWLLQALEHASSGYVWLPPSCRSLLSRLAMDVVFLEGFRAARHSWQASCLVHADLRWTNVLFDTSRASKAWIIDWELACRGDPAWDIGCVLADLLLLDGPDAALEQRARFRAFARVFLTRYFESCRTPAAYHRALLTRSLALAGVRLVQTLLEYGHISDDFLTSTEISYLPLAATLLGEAPRLAESLFDEADDPREPTMPLE